MDENKLKQSLIDVVDNQIKENKPPETAKTLERLKGLGYDEATAKELISQCVSIEVFDIIKNKKPYNNVRYVNNLNNLPELPFKG